MNPDQGTRTRLFPAPSSSQVLAAGQTIASGNPILNAQTLVISADERGMKSSPVTAAGVILIQVDRIYEKARRSVRFGLARFQGVALDLSQADSVEVLILRSALPGVGLALTWAPRPLPAVQSWASWPETVTVAGTYAVPPGATDLVAATADPAFAWVGSALDGSTITLPSPLVAGDGSPVRAALYSTSGTFTGIWRIQL